MGGQVCPAGDPASCASPGSDLPSLRLWPPREPPGRLSPDPAFHPVQDVQPPGSVLPGRSLEALPLSSFQILLALLSPRSLITEHGAPPAWAAVSSQASPAQRPLPLPPSVYTESSALPQPWGPFQRKQSRRGEAARPGLEAEGTKSGCARGPDGQGCPCVLRSLHGVQGLPGRLGPWVTPRTHVSWADLLQVPYPPSRSWHPWAAPPLLPSLAPGGGVCVCLASPGTGSPVQDLPCRLEFPLSL